MDWKVLIRNQTFLGTTRTGNLKTSTGHVVGSKDPIDLEPATPHSVLAYAHENLICAAELP